MTIFIKNRKVGFDYEIVERFEAGIELFGFEVKAVRAGMGSLVGSYVTISDQGALLIDAHIPPYQPNNTTPDYDPLRARRLLMKQSELILLKQRQQEARLTIVPISMYNVGRYIKVEIALVRGKKKHDKRSAIKKKDTERDLRHKLKNRAR